MQKGFRQLKVAAISMKPKKWDKEANAVKMERFFRKAAGMGAKVAVITEGALEGYVVMDAIRKPELAIRLLEISEPRDGHYIKMFSNLAKELKMCLCLGLAERVADDVYNSAIFIDHDGIIRGDHHKMQFAEGYHPSWFFNRMGEQIRAFETPFGRAGFLICNDRWNPALGRALVLDGAQVIYILAYGSKKLRQDRAVLARARENGIPVVEANVGVNLIISRGEVVANERGVDKITVADIDIPTMPSATAAREVELEFLADRPQEMAKEYVKTMGSMKKRKVPSMVSSGARPRSNRPLSYHSR
jgi:predicted amidohydrolase